MFNFKDKQGLEKYKKMTSGNILSTCFEKDNCNSDISGKKWFKEYKNILQRCFKKIRITSKNDSSDLTSAIQNRSSILEEIEQLKNSHCPPVEASFRKLNDLKIRLEESENSICSLNSAKNAETIRSHYANLTEGGCFNLPKMWALKRKLYIKGSGNPVAKKDISGNLITSRSALLQVYQLTYIEIQPQFAQLKDIKDSLFETRLEIAKNRKSADFTVGQVEGA